ncbi:heat-inducible transcription repressor [Candidatus Phytoplasma luffae]|uniref:Heat-inducible transcription repressor HrcA n=1 Tax=Loofah witches'-broom phytoplasma TaxID=35773 RepID=A0A975FIM1_LOWBP|nr:heat-inducible transcriptional repressor HrcA [Candidatus Phytoplasma luffae]QTX02589.1 heat-inducible transcription repressor [Candidatus Phytoplasma luffae]
MLSNRNRLILKAVVENYLKYEKPIGSELLSKIPYLNFSSATLRYDMNQLEKKGYLEKTHTSSGRIPSLKGYIFYFNNLITRKQETIEIFSLFEQISHKNNLNKEKIIKEILKLVSELTNNVIINIRPNILQTSKIKKIDLIFINSRQIVILTVTDKGNLQYKNIFFEEGKELVLENLEKVVVIFNDFLVDKYLYEVLDIIQSDIFITKISKYIEYKEKFIKFFLDSFYKFLLSNVSIYGLSNFLDSYEHKTDIVIKDFYEALDKKKLINFFCNPPEVICKLANQISLMPYQKFILLSIPYNINENEKGFLAVLNFNIMKYQELIPILEYLSAHISHLYEKK